MAQYCERLLFPKEHSFYPVLSHATLRRASGAPMQRSGNQNDGSHLYPSLCLMREYQVCTPICKLITCFKLSVPLLRNDTGQDEFRGRSQVMYWTSCKSTMILKIMTCPTVSIGEIFNRVLTRKKYLCRYEDLVCLLHNLCPTYRFSGQEPCQ